MSIKGAQDLLKEVTKQRNKWNERSMFKIKGVGNLSQSDLDTLELYAETFLREGNLNSLMKQYGEVGEVLAKYGLK